jgi:hypothetical protein
MRTGTKLLVSMLVIALCAAAALGQDSGIRTVSGRVASVDAKAGTLVVRPETASLEPLANVTLVFDERTKIRKSGLKIKLADIHPGDVITASFQPDPARNLALAVMIE